MSLERAYQPATASLASDRTPSFSSPSVSNNPGHANPIHPVSAQGPHSLSLKVMRISNPTLATYERPYHEDLSYPPVDVATLHLAGIEGLSQQENAEINHLHSSKLEANGLVDSIKQSLTLSHAQDMLSNQPAVSEPQNQTVRDWPISSLLVLPNSFGTIFLGETFHAYLSIRNESQQVMREPSFRVEMQTGDGEAGTPPIAIVQLAHVILETPSNQDEADPIYELSPHISMETTVKYDIKDLGPHVLICTVGYKAPVQEGDHIVWAERSFRKFYKFAVPTSPISVRTKTHGLRTPLTLMHPDHKVREKILFEVQVQNISGSPLVFEGVTLHPRPEWKLQSVDRPDQGVGDPDSLKQQHEQVQLWKGIQEPLLPDDVRQYLFSLCPSGDEPLRPLPPIRLVQSLFENDQPRTPQSDPDKRALINRIQTNEPATPSSISPANDVSSAIAETSPIIVSDSVGYLDISWRMSLGEPGRLQTSQLFRKRIFTPPIRCSPDPQTSHDIPDKSVYTIPEVVTPTRDNPALSTTPVIKVEETGTEESVLGPAFIPTQGSSRSLASTEIVHASDKETFPNPVLEADIVLQKQSLEALTHVRAGDQIQVDFTLWIRDISALMHQNLSQPNQQQQPQQTQHAISPPSLSVSSSYPSNTKSNDDQDDDSDDDRPLSEIASPKYYSRQLPDESRRSSSASSFPNQTATRQAQLQPPRKGTRKLRLAIQHISLPHDYHQQQQQFNATGDDASSTFNSNSHNNGTAIDSRSPTTLGKLSSPAPNVALQHGIRSSIDSIRSETGSLFRALTSPTSGSGPSTPISLKERFQSNNGPSLTGSAYRKSLQQNLSNLVRTGSVNLNNRRTNLEISDQQQQHRFNELGDTSPSYNSETPSHSSTTTTSSFFPTSAPTPPSKNRLSSPKNIIAQQQVDQISLLSPEIDPDTDTQDQQHRIIIDYPLPFFDLTNLATNYLQQFHNHSTNSTKSFPKHIPSSFLPCPYINVIGSGWIEKQVQIQLDYDPVSPLSPSTVTVTPTPTAPTVVGNHSEIQDHFSFSYLLPSPDSPLFMDDQTEASSNPSGPHRAKIVRIGGIRLLCLGWTDEFDSDGPIAHQHEPTTVTLSSPVILREWPVVAEFDLHP